MTTDASTHYEKFTININFLNYFYEIKIEFTLCAKYLNNNLNKQ